MLNDTGQRKFKCWWLQFESETMRTVRWAWGWGLGFQFKGSGLMGLGFKIYGSKGGT